jgi:hypothetical protein
VLWLEKHSMLETISVFNLDDRDKDIPIVEAIGSSFSVRLTH